MKGHPAPLSSLVFLLKGHPAPLSSLVFLLKGHPAPLSSLVFLLKGHPAPLSSLVFLLKGHPAPLSSLVFLLKGHPAPLSSLVRHRRVPPPATRECACGVCDPDETDYDIFDDNGQECCRCVKRCFPAAARVSLENGNVVKMSDLHVGDRVQTGGLWSNACSCKANVKEMR